MESWTGIPDSVISGGVTNSPFTPHRPSGAQPEGAGVMGSDC